MGPTRRARCVPRATLRAAGPVRGRDRIAARRVDGARAARHRPPSTSRLCPSRGAVAGDRARSARPAHSRSCESASLPVAPRRLLRPPQLPQPLLETRSNRGGHRAAAPRLRSPPHVRNLRPPCRHLNLRPLALYGSQPDHDRPPLRPPRARRTRARNPAPRRLRGHQSRRRPSLGRPMDAAAAPASPIKTTETAPEQEETESPLTDSNRRPPPYNGSLDA